MRTMRHPSKAPHAGFLGEDAAAARDAAAHRDQWIADRIAELQASGYTGPLATRAALDWAELED